MLLCAPAQFSGSGFLKILHTISFPQVFPAQSRLKVTTPRSQPARRLNNWNQDILGHVKAPEQDSDRLLRLEDIEHMSFVWDT